MSNWSVTGSPLMLTVNCPFSATQDVIVLGILLVPLIVHIIIESGYTKLLGTVFVYVLF